MDNPGLEQLICDVVTEFEHNENTMNHYYYDMSRTFAFSDAISTIIDSINYSIENGILKP